MPTGTDAAHKYEELIEEIFSAIFYPYLCNPRKQHEIHEGRKRIDITYTNEARNGFFAWLANHYPCAFLFVECKNYGREIGNPEMDQLSGRFSPSRGQVGVLVCRSVDNPQRLQERCKDTAKDHRGFVMALTDEDVISLINDVRSNGEFSVLRNKFQKLVD